MADTIHDTVVIEQDSPASDDAQAPITSTGASRRFTPNLVANLISFTVTISIGLFFVPYLIRHIGWAGYGLFQITTTSMLYMGILTLALNSAVGRFLTIAVEQGDLAGANRIFNTSLFGSIALAAAVGIPALLLSPYLHRIISIPHGTELDATRLFICAVCAFILTTIATPFEVATFCRNRLDLRNAVLLSGTFVRIGLIILLFSITVPRLWHVGLSLAVGAAASLVGAVLVCRTLLPFLKTSLSSFSKKAMKDLTHLGGWSAVNQLGGMLYLGTDVLIVNLMIGPEACGRFSAVAQWPALLRALAHAIGQIFGPPITAYYARNDTAALIAYCRRSTKLIGLALAVPIGIISGFSKPLLHVWFGPDLEPLAPLMSLMALSLSITLSITALYYLQIGANSIKVPGLVTCAMGLVNIALAVLFTGTFRWGVYGVALAAAITLAAKDLVFTPWYASRILKTGRTVFFGTIWPILLATTLFAALCYAASFCLHQWTWAKLIPISSLLGLAFWAASFRLLLTSEERGIAVGLLPSFIGDRCKAAGIRR